MEKYIVTIGDDWDAYRFGQWAKTSKDIKHFKQANICGSYTFTFYAEEATARRIEELGFCIYA